MSPPFAFEMPCLINPVITLALTLLLRKMYLRLCPHHPDIWHPSPLGDKDVNTSNNEHWEPQSDASLPNLPLFLKSEHPSSLFPWSTHGFRLSLQAKVKWEAVGNGQSTVTYLDEVLLRGYQPVLEFSTLADNFFIF